MAGVHSHHRCWSKLQKKILALIFERISELSDLRACLAVCSSWRSAVATTVCGGCRIAATPLLLILPPTPNHPQYHKQKEEKEEELLSKVFAFGENNPLIREFCISSPIQLMNTNCAIFGSHRGWLLMHYDPPTSTPHTEVSVYHSLLYNPVTRVHVKLPPPPPGGGKLFRRGTLFTSTTPSNPNCVVVVMFQDQLRVPNRKYHALFASCKPAATAAAGDWSIIKRSNNDPYDDMFFCKDAEELYAVDMNGELFLFDFKESRVVEEKVVVENSGIVLKTRFGPNNFCIYHLVELESGEVLMVQRLVKLEFTGGKPMTMKTLSFRFFKLKWRSKSTRTAEWEEERSCFCSSTGTDNRNQALLLEYGDSMFVSNTEYKPNCIYFIDGWQHAQSFNYFKVYDLDNHTITQHLIHHLNPSFTQLLLLNKGFYCRWFRTSNI